MTLGCEWRQARKRLAEIFGDFKKDVSWDLTLGRTSPSERVDCGRCRNSQHSKNCVSLSPRVENLKVKKVINVSYRNNRESSVFRISLHLYFTYSYFGPTLHQWITFPTQSFLVFLGLGLIYCICLLYDWLFRLDHHIAYISYFVASYLFLLSHSLFLFIIINIIIIIGDFVVLWFCRWKWTQRHGFKSWTGLFAFHIVPGKGMNPTILPQAMSK